MDIPEHIHTSYPATTPVTHTKRSVAHSTDITKLCSSHAQLFPTKYDQRYVFSTPSPFGKGTVFHYPKLPKKYKDVTHCLFDMDGTIIDSETQYHKILKDICAKRGKKYTKDLQARVDNIFAVHYNDVSKMMTIAQNIGATDEQICTRVVEELQLNLTAEDLEKELRKMTKIMLPRAPLKKGVERLLKHLRRSGVLFALATNSTRTDVRLHVATKPQIFKMFHHMVCAGDPEVDRGKPFPDLYLMAASKFPQKPQPIKCLVFEDSLVGLEAALAAGMQVVMTPPKSLSWDRCSKATLVLESLEHFKPEWFGLPPFNDYLTKKPSKHGNLNKKPSKH